MTVPPPAKAPTLAEIAEVLACRCNNAAIASVLNGLLSAEADDSLTDRQVCIANLLFETLCERRPEAVEIAQQG